MLTTEIFLIALNYVLILSGAFFTVMMLIRTQKRLSEGPLAKTVILLTISFGVLLLYKLLEELIELGLLQLPLYTVDFVFSLFLLTLMYTTYFLYNFVKTVSFRK
jgi:hypothetical protein